MIEKTLIGKMNYLFLINDSSKELEVHCNNLLLVKDIKLTHLIFDKYLLVVFPNKSLYYKNYLPDNYNILYRPLFEIYKKKLNNKILDVYEFIKNIDDCYYKTDTHINLKGNYIVYLEFINKINNIFNLNIIPRNITINKIDNIELNILNCGIGDLTWLSNLGNQTLIDKKDNYYFNDVLDFYCKYKINNNDNIFFYDYKLNNKTNDIINTTVDWNIISNYILLKKNNDKTKKVLIFYDSFLLNIILLYLNLFNEVYMIKSVYNNNLINLINPDFVFEFRVERFLM